MIVAIEHYMPSIGGIAVNHSILADPSNYTTRAKRDITYIVMHYTGNRSDSAEGNARYFHGRNRDASAHFFVDEHAIYQPVLLKNVAWHCGASKYRHPECRNANSIGIEMCCSGNYKISETTKENAAQLCASLCAYLGISASAVSSRVLRHYDVTGKRCPAQMVDNSAEWSAFLRRVQDILGGITTQPTVPVAVPSQPAATSKTATATGKSSAYNAIWKVKALALVLRHGPGKAYGKIATMPVNSKFVCYGYYSLDVKGNVWLYGQYKGQTGFCSLSYLKK